VHRLSCRSGFTLLEVVIALALLAVSLLAVASGMGAVTRLTSEGRHLSHAAALLESRASAIRAAGCTAGGTSTDGLFTVTWAGASVPRGRIVSITVSWPGHPLIQGDTVTFFQRCPP
jgi:prepilin-type N-terminal cleavage/methylation domain-containing protein